jgi:imidazolonepropionase-like amidohydrolase
MADAGSGYAPCRRGVRLGAELGTVEVGKLADLIVVGANPLEDITNVRRLQLVLKEGRVISDKRRVSGAVP